MTNPAQTTISAAQEKLLAALNGLYLIDKDLRTQIITSLPRLTDEACEKLLASVQSGLEKQTQAFTSLAEEQPEFGEKLIAILNNAPRKLREAAELDSTHEDENELQELEQEITNI